MKNQLLIAMDCSFGSNGEKIAKQLAEDLNLKVYSQNILDEMGWNMTDRERGKMMKLDEKPPSFILRRKVRDFTYSREDSLSEAEFHFIREKANQGESFILIGHCGSTILAGCDGLVRLYVTSNSDDCIANVSKMFSITPQEANRYIRKMNWRRKKYNNNYAPQKWACSLYYDLCINSSTTGDQFSVKLIEEYIHAKQGAAALA